MQGDAVPQRALNIYFNSPANYFGNERPESGLQFTLPEAMAIHPPERMQFRGA